MCSSMPYETSTQTAKLHFKEVKQSKKEDTWREERPEF